MKLIDYKNLYLEKLNDLLSSALDMCLLSTTVLVENRVSDALDTFKPLNSEGYKFQWGERSIRVSDYIHSKSLRYGINHSRASIDEIIKLIREDGFIRELGKASDSIRFRDFIKVLSLIRGLHVSDPKFSTRTPFTIVNSWYGKYPNGIDSLKVISGNENLVLNVRTDFSHSGYSGLWGKLFTTFSDFTIGYAEGKINGTPLLKIIEYLFPYIETLVSDITKTHEINYRYNQPILDKINEISAPYKLKKLLKSSR